MTSFTPVLNQDVICYVLGHLFISHHPPLTPLIHRLFYPLVVFALFLVIPTKIR